jgi:hypothetical protein
MKLPVSATIKKVRAKMISMSGTGNVLTMMDADDVGSAASVHIYRFIR